MLLYYCKQTKHKHQHNIVRRGTVDNNNSPIGNADRWIEIKKGLDMVEYKGYVIEFNIYGMNEFSVQYCGDDLIFESEIEAKKFIDELQ